MHAKKKQLLEAGLKMLLERGYNDLGIQALLEATDTHKGSFYHHFASKEDFALEVVDLYMIGVHQALDAFLGATDIPPLQRIRNFFEAIRDSYRSEGYLGCLLGGLGQELSGVSELFAKKIETCLSTIGENLARCLIEAKLRQELPEQADPQQISMVLVNCWEGAALRSRLQRREAPLDQMLDFCFHRAFQA